MRKVTLLSHLLFLMLLTGCIRHYHAEEMPLASIHIMDRNGISETIHAKERLSAFEKTDFLSPQPYQKVMRVFERKKNGDLSSHITSYHPNGQVKQFLEVVNQRAFGRYLEWHPNGQLKVEAKIIGGVADLNLHAEQSWLFDGISKAWDEEGHLLAEICYSRGELEGESRYFHPNGQLWKKMAYQKNQLEGRVEVYLANGQPFLVTHYKEGKKEGLSIRYWDAYRIAFQEEYSQDLLKEAFYYSYAGEKIAHIYEGKGIRALFGERELLELQEYAHGMAEGKVTVLDSQGRVAYEYSQYLGQKEGEEIHYFAGTQSPKLLLNWHEGQLHGPMKTWYDNGQLESQRELSSNQKQGLLTAWYPNGSLMLVEEYEQDHLTKGQYYRSGEQAPISQIEKGSGIATLFTPEGHFSKKITYDDGLPLDG